MTTNYRGYQYLYPALVLSPSCKAMTQLANERICVVRLWEVPGRRQYSFFVINFITGVMENEGQEGDLTMLQEAFSDVVRGLSSIDWRIWIPLEWWQPPT